MIGRRLGAAVCVLTGLLAALVWARSSGADEPSPAAARLQARVKRLEEENAGLRRDYELILTTCQSQTATRLPAEDDPAEVPVDYAIIESNKIFISYAWTLTISNSLDRAQAFDVTLHFLDRNGSLIETAREDNEMFD